MGAKRKRHAEELKAKMALETIRDVRTLSEDLAAPDIPGIDRAVEAPVGGSGDAVVPRRPDISDAFIQPAPVGKESTHVAWQTL